MNIKKETMQLISYCILVLLCTFVAISNLEYVVADEIAHWTQIQYISHGYFKQFEGISVFPGYHAIIAFFLKISGILSEHFARFIHLLVSCWVIPIFYYICKRLNQQNINYRCLLFLCCPIILPFFSVLYTDIPAVLFTLLTFLSVLKERYILSAVFGSAAIAIRQTSLIWVVFCGTYIILQFWKDVGKQGLITINKEWWATLKKVLPLFLVSLTAVTIFLLNKGVVLGDVEHQYISINLSNLYSCLLILFPLFLPQHINYFPRYLKLLTNNKQIWVIVFVVFTIYFFTYSNPHPYNNVKYSYFFFNIILHYTSNVIGLKIITFIPIMLSTFMLYLFWLDSDNKPELLLLYIFAIFSIVPLPLVTLRYNIVAIVFIYMLKPSFFRIDKYTLMLYLPLNCIMLTLIVTERSFVS